MPSYGEILTDVRQSLIELRAMTRTADGDRRAHLERRIVIYEEIERIVTDHAKITASLANRAEA